MNISLNNNFDLSFLPLELQEMIFQYLKRCDLCALRLVSKNMNDSIKIITNLFFTYVVKRILFENKNKIFKLNREHKLCIYSISLENLFKIKEYKFKIIDVVSNKEVKKIVIHNKRKNGLKKLFKTTKNSFLRLINNQKKISFTDMINGKNRKNVKYIQNKISKDSTIAFSIFKEIREYKPTSYFIVPNKKEIELKKQILEELLLEAKKKYE